MLFSDIIALVIVYLYVVVIFLLAEKVLKSKPEVSRKLVHIMVGNMIFAMPFFSDPSILLWFITLPITIALFFFGISFLTKANCYKFLACDEKIGV